MPNVSVPVNSTQYCYTFTQLPSDATYFAIGESAMVTNKNYVHHIILWSCPFENITANNIPQTTFCDNQWRSATCGTMFMVWGIGRPSRIYPPRTGKPFGRGTTTSYVLIEVHYSEVDKVLYDTSGFYIDYTTEALPNPIGVTFFGQDITQLSLPAGLNNVNASGACTAVSPFCC
jgi:hypothetical protein